jgi:hypothetical protein
MTRTKAEGWITSLGVLGIFGFLGSHWALAWRFLGPTAYALSVLSSLSVYASALVIGHFVGKRTKRPPVRAGAGRRAIRRTAFI